jgi:DNA polymerase
MEMTPEEALAAVRNRVGNCQRCPLHASRTRLVFGEGNSEANIMFVGEAPGGTEDERGLPFVGVSGLLLNRILKMHGVDRSEVYIANVLKCRPPANRDPEPAEIQKCSPVLDAQIRLISPRVLIALGRFAGNYLGGFQEPQALVWLRRQELLHQNDRTGVMGMPLRVMAHPSYVLRQSRNGSRIALETFVNDMARAIHIAKR